VGGYQLTFPMTIKTRKYLATSSSISMATRPVLGLQENIPELKVYFAGLLSPWHLVSNATNNNHRLNINTECGICQANIFAPLCSQKIANMYLCEDCFQRTEVFIRCPDKATYKSQEEPTFLTHPLHTYYTSKSS